MAFFGKIKREPGWLAIQFSTNGMSLAHCVGAAIGRAKVTRCEFHRLPGNRADALEKLRKQERLDIYRCTALLNPGEYQMLLLEAPNVPPAELKSAIRWHIRDLLNYPVGDATVDVLTIPADKSAPSRSQLVYAVAARNDVIRQCMTLFEEAKVPLAVIDIPETAQRNIANLVEQEDRGVVLLSFDEEGGLLTFSYGGELYVSRRIEVSLGQLQDADDALRRQHYDHVLLELQRSLDHFDRQHHSIPVNKVLLAPLPESVDLVPYLAANLYLPVEMIDLDKLFDFSAIPDLASRENQAHCFHILGAALRIEERAP